jgi:hypothetical protein
MSLETADAQDKDKLARAYLTPQSMNQTFLLNSVLMLQDFEWECTSAKPHGPHDERLRTWQPLEQHIPLKPCPIPHLNPLSNPLSPGQNGQSRSGRSQNNKRCHTVGDWSPQFITTCKMKSLVASNGRGQILTTECHHECPERPKHNSRLCCNVESGRSPNASSHLRTQHLEHEDTARSIVPNLR